MPKVVDAELVCKSTARIGEGPTWDSRSNRLIWNDIPAGDLHLFDPESGDDQVVNVGEPLGTAVPRASGGFLLAVKSGFATIDLDTEKVEHIWQGVPDDLRMNDAKCDPAGRFWAGTMGDGSTPNGTLYRLDPDLTVTPVVDGLKISNGLAWTADGKTMYFIDSMSYGIDAFDYDVDTGAATNRRRVFDVGGGDELPDGMTIDIDDCIWVATWGGHHVLRLTPTGEIDVEVRVPPTASSSCTFGGPNLDTLYITTASGVDGDYAHEETAGSVFAVSTGHQGRPAVAFAG